VDLLYYKAHRAAIPSEIAKDPQVNRPRAFLVVSESGHQLSMKNLPREATIPQVPAPLEARVFFCGRFHNAHTFDRRVILSRYVQRHNQRVDL